MAAASDRDLLELRGISKRFAGVQALDDVHFELRAGEVHALVGENGAGKSTLMKILSGVYKRDKGNIILDGQAIEILDPAHAQQLGVSSVPQEISLEPYLTVAENIYLGRQPKRSVGPGPRAFGMIDWGRMMGDARALLRDLNVQVDPSALAGRLSIADEQMVAIVRAVSSVARIIIFDEPTSSLTARETDVLFATIDRLRRDGFGIIYITHRMDEIFRLCDRITVLRDGRYVATKSVQETNLEEVIRMMIGREVGDFFAKEKTAIGAPALAVRGLTKQGLLRDISFTVHRGEIVGIAGLVGAGRTELARCVFGDLSFDSGEVEVDGQVVRLKSPSDAIRAGIGLVPEDRKEQGLVLPFSITHNISLPLLRWLARFQIIDVRGERRVARRFVERLGIRTPSIRQRVALLSGGNQQRVVLAKWLAISPKVLLVDEPTRGVDVAAKAEIHALLSELARDGVAILMISSELPEILAMSDRILVMHQGQITGELPASTATQESIMRLATGQQDAPLSVPVVGEAHAI